MYDRILMRETERVYVLHDLPRNNKILDRMRFSSLKKPLTFRDITIGSPWNDISFREEISGEMSAVVTAQVAQARKIIGAAASISIGIVV